MIAPAGPTLASRGRRPAHAPLRLIDCQAAALRHLAGDRGMRGSTGQGWDAATPGRTRRAFNYVSGLYASADRHLTATNLARLRELCRAHDRNSALLSGLLNRACDNIFGPNFSFRPNTGEDALDRQGAEYIASCMEPAAADAAGVRSFPEIARTALRALWTDGDLLLAKRPEGALLAFEADQLESPGESEAAGRRVVLGVELDDLGRHLAYWVRSRPTRGDYGAPAGGSPPPRRIPAGQAIFPAHRTRFAQTRGVPFLAAALSIFDRLDAYLDNETLAAELNSTAGWSITKEATDQEPLDGEDTNLEASADQFPKTQEFLPGWIWEGEPGEKVEMVGANRPGTQFEPYVILAARIVGAAVGFPLELLLLDFSKTSWSSARASLSESRRTFRTWQAFCETTLCRPWYRWQIDRGIASGRLPARPELYRTLCQWPAWNYVNPQQEAMANRLLVSMGAKSISECIRETGRVPLEVFDELQADRRELTKRRIPIDVPANASGGGPAMATPPGKPSKKPDDGGDEE